MGGSTVTLQQDGKSEKTTYLMLWTAPILRHRSAIRWLR
jgi:hypothetical protein